MFLSVAGRMLDGDQLYAEVVRQQGSALLLHVCRRPLGRGMARPVPARRGLARGWQASSVALLARGIGAPRSAVVAGFFVYPLALTAGWYLVGLSMLGCSRGCPVGRRGCGSEGGSPAAGVARRRGDAAQAQPGAARPRAARRAARARGARGASAGARSPAGPRLGGALAAASRSSPSAESSRSYLEVDHAQRPLRESAARRADGTRSVALLEHLDVVVGLLLPRGPLAGAGCAVLVLVAFARRRRSRRGREGRVPSACSAPIAAATLVGALGDARPDGVLVGAPPAARATRPPSSPLSLIWRRRRILRPASGSSRGGRRHASFALWSTLKTRAAAMSPNLGRARPISVGARSRSSAPASAFSPTPGASRTWSSGSNSESAHAVVHRRRVRSRVPVVPSLFRQPDRAVRRHARRAPPARARRSSS